MCCSLSVNAASHLPLGAAGAASWAPLEPLEVVHRTKAIVMMLSVAVVWHRQLLSEGQLSSCGVT